jgi:hypothetical protein
LFFLKTHKFKRIEDNDISQEMKDFIIKEAHRLAILRATGIIDQQHRELINPVVPETPTRLVKQFKRLYIALKSLDENYTDERAKSIIKTIVDGSGNVVRNMIMSCMKVSIDWFDIAKLQDLTKIGRNSVKAQLEMLWNMGILDKEVQQRQIGGYNHTYTDRDGHEQTEVRGFQYRDIECYKWVGYDD